MKFIKLTLAGAPVHFWVNVALLRVISVHDGRTHISIVGDTNTRAVAQTPEQILALIG